MSNVAGIIRNSDDYIMKWCPSVAAANRILRDSYGTVEYHVETLEEHQKNMDKPQKVEIRLLQNVLDLIVKKFDAVHAECGLDVAIRYQQAGSVLLDMIEERRSQLEKERFLSK